MFIRIYFKDKPLFLCDAIDAEVEPFVHHDDAVFIDQLNSHTVKTMIHEMLEQKIHAGVFLHHDLEELKRSFFKKFTLIVAAGGLVKNPDNEILLIFRRGHWDLPKGKLDKNEKLETCAVREVEEETGLQNAVIDSPLVVTYHVYDEGTKHFLKESHWYAMHVSDHQVLKPQTEEDITDIKWTNPSDLDYYLENSYPLIRDVIQAANKNNFIDASK